MATKPALAPVPDEGAVEVVATPAVEKESTVRQRLNGQALIALRERHREEFDEIARAAFREAGLTYKRRLNAKEQAAEKIMALAREAGLDVRIVAGEDEDAPAPAE